MNSPTYRVVNRDWFQSLPTPYTTFAEAFEAQKAWDKQAVIECHHSDCVEVCYDPAWENIMTDDAFVINKIVQLKLVGRTPTL